MEKLSSSLRTRYPSIAIAVLALVGAASLSGSLSLEPRAVYGYGKNTYHYHKPSYKKYIADCKRSSCGQANTCKVCAKRDMKAFLTECRLTFSSEKADCAGGDKACARTAKFHLKTCGRTVRGQLRADLGNCNRDARACNHCCNYSKGQGDCSGYFDNSRHPGSYKYKGKIGCPTYSSTSTTTTSPPGSSSAEFVGQVRAIVRGVVGRWRDRTTIGSNWMRRRALPSAEG